MKHTLIALLLTTQLHAFSAKIPTQSEADKGSLKEVSGLRFEKQQKNQWCWIASGKIVLSPKIATLPSQCEIAGKVFKEDCCKTNSVKCNQPQHLEDVAKLYKIKVRSDYTPTFKEAVDIIKTNKAVAIGHSTWAGTAQNTGHYEIAMATYTVKGKEYITVYNPLTGKFKFMDSSFVVGNLAWHQLVSVED